MSTPQDPPPPTSTPGLPPAPAPFGRRVTQRDIAAAAGVHNTTVSLALRNSPALPQGTRERIQAIASQMGYAPDPTVQALVAYRTRLTTHSQRGTIAYVTDAGTEVELRTDAGQEQLLQGARKKAREHGYDLVHFGLGDACLRAGQLDRMLFHRGITGILLATAESGLELAWERLTALRVGTGEAEPPLHRVAADAADNVRQACRRAAALGYGRPGLVASGASPSTARTWADAFVGEMRRLGPAGGASAPQEALDLIFDSGRLGPAADPAFAAWIQRHRPDVLLGASDFVRPALARLGLRLPHEVAFVDLEGLHPSPATAGVSPNLETVGAVAVELLVHQLQRNLRGIPEVPTTTLIRGSWADGTSLPRRRARPVQLGEPGFRATKPLATPALVSCAG